MAFGSYCLDTDRFGRHLLLARCDNTWVLVLELGCCSHSGSPCFFTPLSGAIILHELTDPLKLSSTAPGVPSELLGQTPQVNRPPTEHPSVETTIEQPLVPSNRIIGNGLDSKTAVVDLPTHSRSVTDAAAGQLIPVVNQQPHQVFVPVNQTMPQAQSQLFYPQVFQQPRLYMDLNSPWPQYLSPQSFAAISQGSERQARLGGSGSGSLSVMNKSKAPLRGKGKLTPIACANCRRRKGKVRETLFTKIELCAEYFL